MKAEELHDIFDKKNAWETGMVFTGNCCDCNGEMKILADALQDGFHIEGGAIYTLKNGTRKMKCEPCYKKMPDYSLPSEVYSRVCGYLRPVKNWHNGKQAEFRMRRMFDRTVTA